MCRQLKISNGSLVLLALLFTILFSQNVHAGGVADPVAVRGMQRMLVIVVTFPGSESVVPTERIAAKAARTGAYIEQVSGGMARLETTISGPYQLPEPLKEYSIHPYNAKVDKTRVNRLVRDALNAAGKDHDILSFHHIWISVGVWTKAGTETGYGMICLSANPGFLNEQPSTRERFRMVPVPLTDGRKYTGGIIINTENSILGHVAHDLLHAMGGVVSGERPVPCLYDHYLQSHPPGGKLNYATFAIHMGPWDVMSQHMILLKQEGDEEARFATMGISSFTRMQLGWFRPGQVVTVRPGETREVTLEPLVGGEKELVVMIPLGKRRYILVENRQKTGFDSALPSSGMLVLLVDRSLEEGNGTVKLVNANPSMPHFSGAAFNPGQGERRYFEDAALNLAIIPVALEESGALRIVVTTPSRIQQYLR